jgi:uncharacterized Zn finger protein (UPF0148 family)
MIKAPSLTKHCDLPGCNHFRAFLLDDGRAICAYHGGLFLLGASRVDHENERREDERRKSLPDWGPSGPIEK